jgi:hypothetical protein
MASMIKGLASIKANKQAQQERAQNANRPKAEWLSSVFGVDKSGKTKRLGSTIEVRFLQELDAEMANYREDRGIGFIATEHQAPGNDGYKRRALCTISEEDGGECYPCERHKMNYKEGWKQRQNLYINVLVKDGNENKVYVLSRNGNSAFTDALIQEAVDESSITDAMYRITVSGSGTQTNWTLKRLPNAPLLDDSDVEIFDLDETVIRKVDYDKQPEYYGAVYQEDSVPSVESSTPRNASQGSADDEW